MYFAVYLDWIGESLLHCTRPSFTFASTAVVLCVFCFSILAVLFMLQKEEIFEVELKERRGFIIKKMVPDGACLFRAVGMMFMKIFCYLLLLLVFECKNTALFC